MVVVYLTVFLDLLAFGIILPVMPYYAETLGATGIWLGALMTAYSAAQFIGAPIIGSLSDRYGRRPILLLSLAGSAISLTIAGFATSLGVLLGARIFAGLFGGSIAAAQAYIADSSTPDNRAKYMGLLGACIGLGFVFGPALGALLSPYGFGASAWAAAALCAANFTWGLFRLPESKKPLSQDPKAAEVGGTSPAPQHGFSLQRLVEVGLNADIRPIFAATFVAALGFVAMETTYALLGSKLYGMNARALGSIFTMIGIVMVIVQGGLVGRLSKKFGPAPLAIAGLIINAIALVLLPYAPTLNLSLALLALLAVGQGLSSPTLSTMLSRQVGAMDQGKALGVGQSLGAAARAIGPLLAGALFDVSLPLPYIFAALLGLFGALLVAKKMPAHGSLATNG